MSFEITVPERGVTFPTVTLELDADTCIIFSALLLELGHALEQAGRRYKARKRYEESLPMLRAQQAGLRASMEAKMQELKGLPLNKVVYVLRREFNRDWYTTELFVREVMREERAEALRRRDAEILDLKSKGLTARKIGEAMKLSEGSVRNISSRLNKASKGASSKATAV